MGTPATFFATTYLSFTHTMAFRTCSRRSSAFPPSHFGAVQVNPGCAASKSYMYSLVFPQLRGRKRQRPGYPPYYNYCKSYPQLENGVSARGGWQGNSHCQINYLGLVNDEDYFPCTFTKEDLPAGWSCPRKQHPFDHTMLSTALKPEFLTSSGTRREGRKLWYRVSFKISENEYMPMSFLVNMDTPLSLFLSTARVKMLFLPRPSL
ncbi:hypothetical protein C8F04DRAFT_1228521 [Mycena alexandri]|uniref:Uncharacterized protein n=1 Tax=Mycena alexandri TaxID=1745969 RepID=A0AAD6TE19_9AGAR|nr:hypothetical protein C8F04DRAFT_1228521 [Mycena alexandri]